MAPGSGQIDGEIYTIELIGDHTLVTVKADKDMLTVKAPKDFTARINDRVGVQLTKDRLFVFNAADGVRVR